jgi:hypothetical protein
VDRLRHDFYRKLSALLVSRFGLLSFEELAAGSMVKRDEQVTDPEKPGRFLPNRADQKSKRNSSILEAGPAKLPRGRSETPPIALKQLGGAAQVAVRCARKTLSRIPGLGAVGLPARG